MKKSVIAVIIVILAVVGIIAFGRSPSTSLTPADLASTKTDNTPAIPVTETTKVSSKVSKYTNAELGFSVNYPTTWQADNTTAGVSFTMPIDSSQVSTVAKLQANVNVISGKCAFPPVTTIKDRATIEVGAYKFNTISMSNSVQGRSYFDRMYSLQQGDLCYMFSFSSITLPGSSKNLTGSNLTQAQNNNKAIISAADAEFTSMVKSFAVVVGPSGEDETKVAPAKK